MGSVWPGIASAFKAQSFTNLVFAYSAQPAHISVSVIGNFGKYQGGNISVTHEYYNKNGA